jgi:endonuclease YncB( thermonuclease family)
MRLFAALVALTLCLPLPTLAKGKGKSGFVVLDGVKTGVRWSDGDSFKFTDGPHKGKGTRLAGYNTLESYGPVHRWGEWRPEELFAIAKGASAVAVSQEWKCSWGGKADGYGRLLIECPELSAEMVRQGIAMAFEVEGKARPAVLAAQKQAREKKAGMWAKGAPRYVVSSVHSADESEGKGYMRVVDTATGLAEQRPHQQVFQSCQEVCIGEAAESSCLVYVPFDNRYRNKPACLRRGGEKSEKDEKSSEATEE